jgi:hypothetical protein
MSGTSGTGAPYFWGAIDLRVSIRVFDNGLCADPHRFFRQSGSPLRRTESCGRSKSSNVVFPIVKSGPLEWPQVFNGPPPSVRLMGEDNNPTDKEVIECPTTWTTLFCSTTPG